MESKRHSDDTLCQTQSSEVTEDGPLIGGDHRIIAPVGTGGMGVVYRALQLSTGREVALKLVRPDRVARPASLLRLEQEAKALARLSHPNVVTIHTTGREPDGRVFVVMELVSGQSLLSLLAATPRLRPDRVIDLLTQLASALAAAHDVGILHRDVKPSNILISPDDRDGDRLKLVDFGLAALLDEPMVETTTGVVMGSPPYMAPERWEGGRNVDGRSDVYSLGCVGYEMLTGSRPFQSDSTPGLMHAHACTVPTDPELIAPSLIEHRALSAIVRRCLQARPQDRFADAGALSDALRPLRALYQARQAAGPDKVALPDTPRAAWSERDVDTGAVAIQTSPPGDPGGGDAGKRDSTTAPNVDGLRRGRWMAPLAVAAGLGVLVGVSSVWTGASEAPPGSPGADDAATPGRSAPRPAVKAPSAPPVDDVTTLVTPDVLEAVSGPAGDATGGARSVPLEEREPPPTATVTPIKEGGAGPGRPRGGTRKKATSGKATTGGRSHRGNQQRSTPDDRVDPRLTIPRAP